MESFKGYVLQAELIKKAKVSDSLFSQMNLQTKQMGQLVCIYKNSLPEKYKKIAQNCQDLKEFCSYSFLSDELGMCTDYIAVTERYKTFEYKKIGHVKLFKLSNEFVEMIEKGLTPFKIKDKEDEKYADKIIKMQGIKIGFH